jgi:hypothetical protein
MLPACRIECFTRSQDGAIAGFAGSDGEGRPWSFSSAALIRAIVKGDMTCYVTFEGHAHLVTVQADAAGTHSLMTILGELETLLPVCR